MAEQSMVERAAEAHFLDGLTPPRGCPLPTWAEQPEAVKQAHRRKARAAMEAMRTHLREVLDAAEELYLGDGSYDDGSAHEEFVVRAFEAFDAALKD